MAYNIFSQPQGPQIDVDLFGSAVAQGIQAGNQLPTPLTSAIRGVQEGVKLGQDYRQNEAQIDNAESVAKINGIKAQIAEQTQQLQIEETEAELTARRDQLLETAALRKRKNEFLDVFKNSDPQQQAQMVLSGQYQDVFAADKDLYGQALQGVYANPNNGIDENLRNNVGRILRVKGTQEYYDNYAKENLEQYDAALKDVRKSPLTAAIASQTNIPIEDLPNQVVFEPGGKYLVNPSTGKKVLDPETMEPQIDPTWKERNPNARLDVFAPDGTRLLSWETDEKNVAGEGYVAYNTYKTQASYQNGRQKELAINQVLGADEPSGKSSFDQQSSQEGMQAEAITNEDPFISSIKTTFNVDDSVTQELTPSIKGLQSKLSRYANSASARTNPGVVASINSDLNVIARTISDKQYDSNPALKAKYTQADVDAYNKALADTFSLGEETRPGVYSLRKGADLYGAFKVNTPQDLYYVKQQKVLDNQLQQIVNNSVAKAQADSTQAVRAQASKNRMISRLTKEANGIQSNR